MRMSFIFFLFVKTWNSYLWIPFEHIGIYCIFSIEWLHLDYYFVIYSMCDSSKIIVSGTTLIHTHAGEWFFFFHISYYGAQPIYNLNPINWGGWLPYAKRRLKYIPNVKQSTFYGRIIVAWTRNVVRSCQAEMQCCCWIFVAWIDCTLLRCIRSE